MSKVKKEKSSIAAPIIAIVLLAIAACLWLSERPNLLPWARGIGVLSVVVGISYAIIVSPNDWRRQKFRLRKIFKYPKKKQPTESSEENQPPQLKDWTEFHPDTRFV